MTRPMPGPPTAVEVHTDWWNSAEWVNWQDDQGRWRHVSVRELSAKHLSDAECAAEKWRALSSAMFLSWAPLEMLGVEIPTDGQLYSVTRPDPTEAEIEAATWDRFATHPHAFKETPNDRP